VIARRPLTALLRRLKHTRLRPLLDASPGPVPAGHARAPVR
jgi:hypothetical protein